MGKKSVTSNLGAVLSVVFIVLLVYGWGANIWKFAHLNFEAPYKAEIIRGVGIVAAPVGVIAGYMNFSEENDE